MNFVLQMAWRDSRASRRRLLFFSLSIVLGVAALVAIGSFGVNLGQAVNDQANGLLGADLAITVNEVPDANFQQWLDALPGERSRLQNFGSNIVFQNGTQGSRITQMRRIEGNYPFYGTFTTEPEDAPSRLRAGGAVAIVDKGLLAESHAKVGDTIKVGPKTYTVVGALKEFPGESPVMASFAPPVLVPWADPPFQDKTGKRDNRAYRLFVKLPAGVSAATLAAEFDNKHFAGRPAITTADKLRKNVADGLSSMDRFFSLVGFVALFLGSIGVASTIHVYVRQKLNTVAILRCLGMAGSEGFLVYLIQGAALGLFGAILGAGLGVAVQFALPALVRDLLPFPVRLFVAWTPIGVGMVAGFIVCLLFTLLPLLAVRRVPPLAVLRSAYAESAANAGDPLRTAIGGLIVLAVAGFAVWQTDSPGFGVGYAVFLTVSLGIFAGTAWLVSAAARRWFPKNMPYVFRQGVANLHRPNNRTMLLLVSLGLGTFLILTLYLTRSTLLHQFAGDQRPNLVFPQVPDDQAEPLAKLIKEQGGRILDQVPVVQIKAVSINGKPVADLMKARVQRGRGLPASVELVATYRDALRSSDEVVAGKFTGHVEPGTAVIPIATGERGAIVAGRLLRLNDKVIWDVQGLPIETLVTCVKRSDGPSNGPNFNFPPSFPVIFPVGALEGAPKNFVFSVRGATKTDVTRIERAAATAFPRVQSLDIALIIEAIDKVFGKVSFVVEFMALFTVATGAIMLATAVVAGRYQRARETVLLRTLGASRRQLQLIQLTEYSILGALAAVVGCLLAMSANALLAQYVFKFPVRFSPLEPVIAVVAAAAVTLITGLLADRGATRQPPLELLRQEI